MTKLFSIPTPEIADCKEIGCFRHEDTRGEILKVLHEDRFRELGVDFSYKEQF